MRLTSRGSSESDEERLSAVKDDTVALRRRIEIVSERGERLDSIKDKSDSLVEPSQAAVKANVRPTMLGRTKAALMYPFQITESFAPRIANLPALEDVVANMPAGIPIDLPALKPPEIDQPPVWAAPESWEVTEAPVLVDDSFPEFISMKMKAKKSRKRKQNDLSVQEEVQGGVQGLILKWTTLDVSEIA